MPISRHGALYVAETAAAAPEIDRALKRLDPRLFLEKQIDLDQREVWTVQLAAGDQIPVWVYDWRDEDEVPIPEPGWRIVDEIAAMIKRGPIDNEAHRKANAELVERRREEAREEMAQIVHDRVRSLEVDVTGPGSITGRPNHARHHAREKRLRDSDRLVR